jgi:hypothetical protein
MRGIPVADVTGSATMIYRINEHQFSEMLQQREHKREAVCVTKWTREEMWREQPAATSPAH